MKLIFFITLLLCTSCTPTTTNLGTALFGTLVCASCVKNPPPPLSPEAIKGAKFFVLAKNDKYSNAESLGRVATEMLIGKRYTVVARSADLNSIINEVQTHNGVIFNKKDRVRLGELSGANNVLILEPHTEVEEHQTQQGVLKIPHIGISASILDIKSGTVIWSRTEQLKEGLLEKVFKIPGQVLSGADSINDQEKKLLQEMLSELPENKM